MISVKIHCPCGQKFRFKVIPVNGRMPAPVHCPNCRANATEVANQNLARQGVVQTWSVTPPAAAAPYKSYRTAIVVLSATALIAFIALGALLYLRAPQPEPEPQPDLASAPIAAPAPSPAPNQQAGIGILLTKDKVTGKYMLTNVIPNSPAAKSGLAPGLLVCRINGIVIDNKNISEVVALVRGPAGSKATLELVRPKGEEKPITVELTREIVRNAK